MDKFFKNFLETEKESGVSRFELEDLIGYDCEDDYNENEDENYRFDILTSLPKIRCTYEIDEEEDPEERELEFYVKDLYIMDISSDSEGERGMGIEILHTIEGMIKDNEGNTIKITIQASEYPEGVYNHYDIIEAYIEK